MFCDPRGQPLRMEFFFSTKGGFLLWQGHSETSSFWLFWRPRRLQTNLLDSHQGLRLARCPWTPLIIIWFNCYADNCLINSSCGLINLLRSFVWKFLLPKLCVKGIEVSVLRHGVGGFFCREINDVFLTSFVCFSWKYVHSPGAIYSALWRLVNLTDTSNTVCYIFILSHEYRRLLSALLNLPSSLK